MAINPANPEEGLRTGSVQGAKGGLQTGSVQGAKGGLGKPAPEQTPAPEAGSSREAVAAQYEQDLSGANGALARFDAIEEIARANIQMAFKDMSFGGGGDISIFGADGKFAVRSPRPRRGAAPETPVRAARVQQPWDLVVESYELGTVSIRCGTILKSPANLTVPLSITGAESVFAPSNGQTIRLKLTGPFEQPVVNLEYGGDWQGYPAAYQTVGTGTSTAFAAYYYPLWRFTNTSTPGAITIKEGLYAIRVAPLTHFVRSASVFYDAEGAAANRPVAVPLLLPYHAVLSAE